MGKRGKGKKPDLDPEVEKMLGLRQRVVDALLPRYKETGLGPEQISALSESLVDYITELSWSLIVQNNIEKDFTPTQRLDPEYQEGLRELKRDADTSKRNLDTAMESLIPNRVGRRRILSELEKIVYEECSEVLGKKIEPLRLQ